jgi:hypothetical protein
MHKSYRLFSLSTCISIIFILFQSCNEVARFNPTLLKVVKVENAQYPDMTFKFVALRAGVPAQFDSLPKPPRFNILEDGSSCEVLKVERDTMVPSYALDLFADFSALKSEQLLLIEKMEQSMAELKGIQLNRKFYISENKRLVETTLNKFNKCAMDSISDPSIPLSEMCTAITQSIKGFENGDHIIILVVKKVTKEEANQFAGLLNRLNQKSLVLGSLISIESPELTDSLLKSPYALGVFPIDLLTEKEIPPLLIKIEQLKHAYYRAEFLVPNPRSLSTSRRYDIEAVAERDSAVSKQVTMNTTVTYSIPDSLVHRSFIKSWLAICQQIADQEYYKQSLDSISIAHHTYASPEFLRFAQTTIIRWADTMYARRLTEEAPSLFHYSESLWGYSTLNDSWYKEVKLRLLERWLSTIQPTDSTLKVRISVLEQITIVAPEKKKYILQWYLLNGRQSFLNENYWISAEWYAKNYFETRDPIIDSTLCNIVRKAATNNYKKVEWDELYKEGKTYTKYILPSFDLRYIYAVACRMNNDYQASALHYEWLVFHWNNTQNLVTWESLLQQLQQSYSAVLRFDDAFRLNQRVFRQKEDMSILFEALKNVRARFLLPAVECLQTMWNRVSDASVREKVFQQNILSSWPHFVQGIYALNSSGKILYQTGNAKKILLPELSEFTAVHHFPAILDELPKKKVAWLISRTGQGYIVIQLAIETDDAEGVILSEIQRRKMLDEPWKKLLDHEQPLCMRALAEIISRSCSAELEAKGTISLSSYWDVLKDYSYFAYSAQYNKKGEVIEQFGITGMPTGVDQAQWQRSSVSLAYMTQEVKHNNQRIIDVVSPLYVQNTWKQVIRIGFKPF